MDMINKTKIELVNEINTLKAKVKELDLKCRKEKLNAYNWEVVAKTLRDKSKWAGGEIPKEEKVLEISVYKDKHIKVLIDNKEIKVKSIEFKASIDEIPTLKIEKYFI